MDISQRCYCSLFGLGWFATWCFKSCDYFLLQFLGTSFFRSFHPLCTFQCLGTFTTFTSILSLLLGKCSMCGWLHGMGAWKDPRASSTKRIFVRNSKGFKGIYLFKHLAIFSSCLFFCIDCAPLYLNSPYYCLSTAAFKLESTKNTQQTMYVYFFSFYSHSIPYESIWIPFFAIWWCLFQHLRVCFHPHGILPLGFSFNGPLGWSIPPRWNQLKKHFVFVQFVWQFVSQPSIFNYLIENCLFIINFHRLRLFETWKTPRALRVKAEAPEQFLPESFNFPKETPYHKLDVKVFPMTLVSIWRCYSCPVASMDRIAMASKLQSCGACPSLLQFYECGMRAKLSDNGKHFLDVKRDWSQFQQQKATFMSQTHTIHSIVSKMMTWSIACWMCSNAGIDTGGFDFFGWWPVNHQWETDMPIMRCTPATKGLLTAEVYSWKFMSFAVSFVFWLYFLEKCSIFKEVSVGEPFFLLAKEIWRSS